MLAIWNQGNFCSIFIVQCNTKVACLLSFYKAQFMTDFYFGTTAALEVGHFVMCATLLFIATYISILIHVFIRNTVLIKLGFGKILYKNKSYSCI